MTEPTKLLALTKGEAEYILDCTKVSNPHTRALALKVAGLCLEWEAEEAAREARTLLTLPVIAAADD